MELNGDLYNQVLKLSEEGDQLFDQGDYKGAIIKYKEALILIPIPKNRWEASTWLYTALGDAYFYLKEYEKALQYLYDANNSSDEGANPFILLRLGQCLFKCGELQKSKELLLRAYMLEGKTIFDGEEPMYFNLIKKEVH